MPKCAKCGCTTNNLSSVNKATTCTKCSKVFCKGCAADLAIGNVQSCSGNTQHSFDD